MSLHVVVCGRFCHSRVGVSLRSVVAVAVCVAAGIDAGNVSAAPQSAAERNRERYQKDVDIALNAARPREERQQAAASAVHRGKDSLGMAWGKMAIEAIRSGRAGGELLVLAAEGAPAPASVDWRPVFEEVQSDPAVGVAILKAMRESPTLWPAEGWKGVVERIGVDNIPRTSAVVGKSDERDVTMEFVLVGPGVYQMGASQGEIDGVLDPDHPAGKAQSHELQSSLPAHQVELTRFFWLGRCEVTQAQWQSVMGTNPSHFKGDPSRPIESVSWNDAQEFTQGLAQRTGKIFRLPTEAEWEYACRAGTVTAWSFGDSIAQASRYAWINPNPLGVPAEYAPRPVGTKLQNPWGLHDMHGNVLEFVADRWYRYRDAPRTDPVAAVGTGGVVARGGGILASVGQMRSCLRFGYSADLRNLDFGFRVVMEEQAMADASPAGGTIDRADE